LGTFFPIYLNTYQGIRYVDRGLVEMGLAYGLNRWRLFWNVVLPGAMPSMMTGINQSMNRMWTALIVAETVAANSGIGYMATSAREYMLMDVILLSLILYALLGVLSDALSALIERYALRWHVHYRKENEERSS
jgi:sulfonate transport system permease protein